MQRTLLLVDDEENIIHSLKRLLRRDGYNILSANSGSDGLALLAQNDVGVIISDQRMPGMSGVEFLSQVKEQFPNNVRIVLSGYTDLKSVTDAINEGAIYKFLTKPWNDKLLRTHVDDAFKHYELTRENKRLTDELKNANNELSLLNKKLKIDVKQKSHLVDINLRTLKIAQEILENLPIGVLGIGEDRLIAVANLKAIEILSPGGNAIIGCLVNQVLPENFIHIYQKFMADKKETISMLTLEDGQKIQLILKPLGMESNSQGSIAVLVPKNGD